MASIICCSLSVDTAAEKLLKALNCLLIENFQIQDKTLLEKLLSSLHNKDDLLKTIPISTHCKWFDSVLHLYKQELFMSKNSYTHLYAFALKYLAVLVKSNNGLKAFIETSTFQSMINQLDGATNLKESLIFNSFISLLHALNTHKQGLEYIFQKGLWKNVFFAINGLSIPAKYVEIQSSQYIADLIYKSFEHEIIHYCEPLFKELFCILGLTDSLCNCKLANNFSTYNVYIKTLILSLEKLIGTRYEENVRQQIVYKYSLSDVLLNIQKLLNVTPILLKNYVTLHLLFDCLTVWPSSDIKFSLKYIFSYINIPKDVQSYKSINNLFVQAIKYANTSSTKLANSAIFEKELIIGQLLPIKKCTEWLKYSKYENIKLENSCIDETNSILDNCNYYDSIINEVAISSIINILDVVPILKQESLDYLVNCFSILTDQILLSDNLITQHLSQDILYYKFLEILSFIFICWTKVLENKLYFENVNYNLMFVPLVHKHSEFFDKHIHNSSVLQNSLKLISTALNKRLYESIVYKDNLIVFDKLCTTLYNLLVDTRPEIRDSCLQCISSLTIASKYKSGYFFTEIILKKKLSLAVLNTLKHDNDPFVKAKALECLENLVSVLDIWETSLKDSDLIPHCINLMQCEAEGIIRRQIVKLFTALFIYNNLSDQLFKEICVVMVHISINDPLWEVKIFSYEFWHYILQKFEKKSCELDITERLNNYFFNLDVTGCLHVLYMALKEEHDLVVQKKAICLTKEILVFINSTNNSFDFNFKLKNSSVNFLNNIDVVAENYMCSKQKKSRQIDSADRILNSISITSDCELLPSLKSMESSNIYPNDICLYQKTNAYISIDVFLNFTSTYDFNDCDAKTQWCKSTRSGLDSMLDDIIGQLQNCFIEGADLIDCH